MTERTRGIYNVVSAETLASLNLSRLGGLTTLRHLRLPIRANFHSAYFSRQTNERAAAHRRRRSHDASRTRYGRSLARSRRSL